jgi:anti-sigma B factor antagonist
MESKPGTKAERLRRRVDMRENVTSGSPAASVPAVELKVSTRSHADHAVVTVAGEIDLYTAPRLQAEFTRLLQDAPPRVVIDMSSVDFCDSTGMNVLLSGLKRMRERGGELEVAAPRPAVRKILQVTGLDSVFTVHNEVPAELLTGEPQA